MHPFKAAQNRPRYRDDQHQHSNGQHARSKNKKELGSSYYAYGKSAAIEFVCDETRKQQINTISMHASSTRGPGERGYDWDNKTIIQLPRNELLDVVAIMLGMLPKGVFKQTGLHSSKSYTVEHQDEKVFFMVMERGKPIRAVGLCPEDTYQVVALFLKQLNKNSPWMTTSEIIDLIEMTVVRMKPEPVEESDEEKAQVEVGEDGFPIDDDFEDEDEQNFNF